ncbi:MAG: P-II family nitrogen regulator [Thermoguttaceae bacterium]
MRLVVAVIQPTKLGAVREALEKMEVTRMTICDAQAFEEKASPAPVHRDGPQSDSRQLDLFPFSAPTLLQKIALEIVVNDDFLDRTIETIISAARTGPTGTASDGKIFILPAAQAIQIDNDARGPGAV